MEKLKFYYTNWKGESSYRTVQDPELWYGESQYHKGKQWFLKAFDVEKQDFRDFALKDIPAFNLEND